MMVSSTAIKSWCRPRTRGICHTVSRASTIPTRHTHTNLPQSPRLDVLALFLVHCSLNCRNEPHNARQSTYKRQQKQVHLPRWNRHRSHHIPRAKGILHPRHTPLPPTLGGLSLDIRPHARYLNNSRERTTSPITHATMSHIGTSGHKECTDSTKSRSEARMYIFIVFLLLLYSCARADPVALLASVCFDVLLNNPIV